MIAPVLVFGGNVRVRIFVDFWNLSLGARDLWGSSFRINYEKFPQILTDKASAILGSQATHEGTYVYSSVDLSSAADRPLNKFLRNVLDHLPGYQVKVFNRKPKHPPKCPSCLKTIFQCPHCNTPIKGTVEKGVDVSIATDMLQHAWDNTYDIGMLVSSDADFIPAVQFLDKRGKKIIHAGFGYQGAELAASCWAHINLDRMKDDLDNTQAPQRH